MSEKLADVLGSEIKYGRGDEEVLIVLSVASQNIRELELEERQHFQIMGSESEDARIVFEAMPRILELERQRLAIVTMLNVIAEALLHRKRK